MKLKAAILLLLFAFTIFNPVIGNVNGEEAKHECCKASQQVNSETPSKNQNNQDSNDCCNNGCNPFVNCCGMMGFVVVDQFQLEEFQSFSEKEFIDTYQSIYSNHEQVIWQPPKV